VATRRSSRWHEARRRWRSGPSLHGPRAATRWLRPAHPGHGRPPPARPARSVHTGRTRSAARVPAGQAERTEHGHLGCLESMRNPFGLGEQRPHRRALAALAHPPPVDLHREQQLVLLADLRAAPDQLQVGLDQRRASQRNRRVTLGVHPARQIVALRGDRPLDPLDPPDRRPGGAGQHRSPACQPPLLRLGIEQREREHPAGQDRRQQPPRALGESSHRPIAVRGLDDPHAAQHCRGDGLPGRTATGWERRSKAPAASHRPRGERAGDRQPLRRRAASQRREREQHRPAEHGDRDQRAAGARCLVEHGDRHQRPGRQQRRLPGADRTQHPPPLERSEAEAQPRAAHRR